jgi:hypothetical protein
MDSSHIATEKRLPIRSNTIMRKKILPATKRTIPRPFSFVWGKGEVVDEASIKVQMNHHSWEPAIQLLRFEDGSETLRFCVFHGKQFSRMPLLISQDELSQLLAEASKHPMIRARLKKSTKRLR